VIPPATLDYAVLTVAADLETTLTVD
jgi:hypothetical protein